MWNSNCQQKNKTIENKIEIDKLLGRKTPENEKIK